MRLRFVRASVVGIVVSGTVSAATAEPAVSQPRVAVAPMRSSITGWGIGSTKIVVTVSGVPSPKGREVMIDVESGTVDPNPVVLDARGRGETTLRSTNADQATITAVGPDDARSPSITVSFDSPWGFLSLAGAAGLGGAFLRRKGRRHTRRAITIGVFSASVVTLAQQVGLNDWVAAVSGAGAALVFVICALTAVVGVSILVPQVHHRDSIH